MALRWSSLALIALVLAAEVGCCCARNDFGPHGREWSGGCQCGEIFWNEWFSIPPCCCDPCDDCGEFCGRKRDSTYSDGKRHTARQPEPVPARPARSEPLPAEPLPSDTAPDQPFQEEPYTSPEATEEMPSPDASTGLMHDELGQIVSNSEPVDSRAPSRKLVSPRRSQWRAR